MSQTSIIPVILSGGSGSRLWPLSRHAMPKQLLPLMGEKTMIQETVERFQGAPFLDPVFICNAIHSGPIMEQMSHIGQDIGAIIIEPMGRNTAACGAISAIHAMAVDKNALVLLVPADHHIADVKAFQTVIMEAAATADNDHIVTLGITPTRAETGYGYIEKGRVIETGGHSVKSFREKPDEATAQSYIQAGNFFWNAGMFLFSPDTMLSEMKSYAPDVLKQAKLSYNQASQTGGVIYHLDADQFAQCPSISIDYAIMEHTSKAAILAAEMGWNDIGSYESLHSSIKDKDGLSLSGDVIIEQCENMFVHSDGPLVCAVGVENLAVTVSDNKILITTLTGSQDVRLIVDRLKTLKRGQDL